MITPLTMRTTILSRACGLALAVSSSTHAFELRQDSTGTNVKWTKPVELVVDDRADEVLSVSGVLDAARAAVAAYQPYVDVPLSVRVGPKDDIGYQPEEGSRNQSEIVALEDWPFDDGAIAVTILTVAATTHEIIDADIALNAASRRFGILPASSQPGGDLDDLQNTLTHEIGHALGLAHNPEDPEAVMYPSAPRGEVKKRVLSTDDLAGLGALYHVVRQAAAQTAQLAQVGCSAAGREGAGAWLMLAAPLAWLWMQRRPAAGRGARTRRTAVRGALALSCLAPASAFASSGQRAPAPVGQASIVATARVTSLRTLPKAGPFLTTEVELTITRCVKGNCPSRMSVVVLGGKNEQVEQWVDGLALPELGSSVGVTLRASSPGRRPAASLYRLDLAKDFVAFAQGLTQAGLSIDLPLQQVAPTPRVANDPPGAASNQLN